MANTYTEYQNQAELDAQYRLEPTVDDFSAYVDWYLSESANSRNMLRHQRAVRYGPTIAETANIFPAPGAGPSPILIFIHGGYWYSLNADAFDLIANGPVAAGFSVVNLNYALCPEVTLGEIVRQIRAAIAWVWHNASSFDGDRDRIFLAGHSAGGHLTMTSILTDWERLYGLPADIIKGGIPISGIYDLEPISRSFLQPTLRLSADEVETCSPMRQIGPSPTPIVVTYGLKETQAFQTQSDTFTTACTAAGNTATELALDRNHFDILAELHAVDGAITTQLKALAGR